MPSTKQQKLNAYFLSKTLLITSGSYVALFLRDPTIDNKERFVAYRNKFKSLRKLVEKIFYATQFMKYNNDLKNTWLTIKTILKANRVITSLIVFW